MELFLADAMWFPACGDWRWDPVRFPNGSAPIADAIHHDGMLFGLWCAWNNGGVSEHEGALSVRGPVGHPDWFGHDLPANWQPGPFYGDSACMGSPEALAWAIDKTQSMVRDYHIDYLKTDVNPMINDCDRTDHRHKYGTDVSYWLALGVYKVWDQLRSVFPNIVLENCSGASHIKDFGVVQRCAYTAVTDTLSNLPDRAGMYDSTYIYPPAALVIYTYEQVYGQPGDDPGPFLFRSGMMAGWDMDPTHSKDWTPEEMAEGLSAVRTYKIWIRPILLDCKVHHVLPRPTGKRWDGLFYWGERVGRGIFYVFRPDTENDRQTVKLAGLDPNVRYRVWSEDGSLPRRETTGQDLMERGLGIHLPTKYSCDLIYVQDAGQPSFETGAAPFAVKSPTLTNDIFGSQTVLSWSPSLGARNYRVIAYSAVDPDHPVIDQNVCSPSLTLMNLVESPLTWSVEARNLGGSTVSAGGSVTPLGPKPFDGRFVSDMPWVSAQAGSNRVHRNENYLGSELVVAGKAYPKGIWTHSFNDGRPADIVVNLEGQGFGEFVADVGLDDHSGGGSIQFQVLVDGKVAAETPVLFPYQMQSLRVNVKDAKLLILRVLNGGDGYNSDHSVWGAARLIKLGSKDPLASPTNESAAPKNSLHSPLNRTMPSVKTVPAVYWPVRSVANSGFRK